MNIKKGEYFTLDSTHYPHLICRAKIDINEESFKEGGMMYISSPYTLPSDFFTLMADYIEVIDRDIMKDVFLYDDRVEIEDP